MSRNVVIGEVMMTLGGMDLTGGEVNVWRELRPHQFQNVSQGRVYVNIKMAINPLVPESTKTGLGGSMVHVPLVMSSHFTPEEVFDTQLIT